MLRGGQTPGELKARTERMQSFESPAELHETLDGLISRELVARLARRPGQKEERYVQLLGGEHEPEAAAEPVRTTGGDVEERLSRLEADVAALRRAVESLSPASE